MPGSASRSARATSPAPPGSSRSSWRSRTRSSGAGSSTTRSALIKAVGNTVKTNIPPSVVRTLAPLAADIGTKDIYRAVVGHPLVRSGFDYRGSIQLPDFSKIKDLGSKMFGPVGTRPPDRYVSKAPTSRGQGAGPAEAEVLRGTQAEAEAKTDPETDPQADEEADADARADPDRRADPDDRGHAQPLTGADFVPGSPRPGPGPSPADAPGSTRPPLLPCARSLEPVL